MKSNTKESIEFIPYIIDGRFYFSDLYSDYAYYVHCNLYDYPREIDTSRHHFKIEAISFKEDRNFGLIIISGSEDLFAWINMIRAQYWFRKKGIKYFNDYVLERGAQSVST